MGGLVSEYEPRFIHTDISIHHLTPIVEADAVADTVVAINIDLSGNSVVTGVPNVVTGPPVANNLYPVTITSVLLRQIEADGSICGITHEDILIDEHYMQCISCNHNFSVDALKTWLQQKIIWSRTCPMCRATWSNYVLYVNRDELD
jgi:hypothetical protein